jgi:hypothetical protein
MSPESKSSVRPLYAWEIHEARFVFGNQLQYEAVRIHENVSWPNAVNSIGMRLKGLPPVVVQNAITLGNHCYFPVKLLEEFVPPGNPEHGNISWLIHELTHAWQYQHLGWRYLTMALQAQIKMGATAYQYGGEQGLIDCFQKGWKLADFNLEQQGDIARDYYERLSTGEDIAAWLPYILEIRQETA